MSRWSVVWAACLIVLGAGCYARSFDLDDLDIDDDDDAKNRDGDEDVEGDESHISVGKADPLSYYAHAKPIIDAKCTGCHVDDGIGPMPLTTYDEVKPYAKLIEASVESGKMPPWTADGPLNRFEGDRRLSPEQRETLLGWLAQDVPEGDPDYEPEVEDKAPPRRLQDVDLKLEIPIDYEPRVKPDDYHCFLLEWPKEETSYITALDIVPGNRKIVHHAIVYHVRPNGVDAVRALDEEEDGPGYTCFGGGAGANAWLQSYEPGGYAQEVPGGLGFEIQPGSLILLQIHYNTLFTGGKDRSHVEFQVKDKVDRVGRVSLIMQPLWLAGLMPIPANERDVMHRYLGRPATLGDASYEIHWADLHMHALGDRGRIGIVRADHPGRLETLLNIPKWDFAWQETYILQEPVVLGPRDQLYVECHFDNTADNQIVVNGERLAPRDVNWGDGTTDEMCLGNVLVTPL